MEWEWDDGLCCKKVVAHGKCRKGEARQRQDDNAGRLGWSWWN